MKGLSFDKARFWVQVHDLLLGSLNMRIATDIVSTARKVVPSKGDDEEFEGGNYM